MLASLLSATLHGLDGRIVRVEVDVAPGLPGFTIVGLADTALQEARERVRGAIRNSGYEYPPRRITVNLAPADLRKGGRVARSGDRARHHGRVGAGEGDGPLGRSGRVVARRRPAPGARSAAHGRRPGAPAREARDRSGRRRGRGVAGGRCRGHAGDDPGRGCDDSAGEPAGAAAGDTATRGTGGLARPRGRRRSGAGRSGGRRPPRTAARHRIWPRSGASWRRGGPWRLHSRAATACS